MISTSLGLRKEGTAKGIRYRSIVSSIKPRFDDQLHILIYVFCTNHEHKIVFVLICFVLNWQNNIRCATCTKHVNQQRIICQSLA